MFFCIYSVVQQHTSNLGHLSVEVSRPHTDIYTHPVELWTSDQPVAEDATYSTNTRDEHPCPHRDSNPRSQQSRGCRPTS